MNIQIFGSSKSFDSKKAERWFKERRIKYQYIDLVKKGVSPGEYRSIRAAVGYENLVNRECLTYRELGWTISSPMPRRKSSCSIPKCSARRSCATAGRRRSAIDRKSGRHGNNPPQKPARASAHFLIRCRDFRPLPPHSSSPASPGRPHGYARPSPDSSSSRRRDAPRRR